MGSLQGKPRSYLSVLRVEAKTCEGEKSKVQKSLAVPESQGSSWKHLPELLLDTEDGTQHRAKQCMHVQNEVHL